MSLIIKGNYGSVYIVRICKHCFISIKKGVFALKKEKILSIIMGLILMASICIGGHTLVKADIIEDKNVVYMNETVKIPIGDKFKLEDVKFVGAKQNGTMIPVKIKIDDGSIWITPNKVLTPGKCNIDILLKNKKKFTYTINVSNIQIISEEQTGDGILKEVIVYPTINKKDFYYPYFLRFNTNLINNPNKQTLIVETVNFGRCGDIKNILNSTIKSRGSSLGLYVADRNNNIFMMPIFPRGVDSNGKMNVDYYQHALDRDTLENRMKERISIDQQVLAMIKDSQMFLRGKGINVEDKIAMIGFSASGDFVNRFSILYPEIIKAMAFQNTKPILPLKEYKGEKLIYPVGIGDIEEITGKPVNMEAYKKIKQYVFVGALDTNDGVYNFDGYGDAEREQIFRLLGRKMIPDRWNNVQKIFKEFKYPIQFVTYQNLSHNINNYVVEDVFNFINENTKDENFYSIQPTNTVNN